MKKGDYIAIRHRGDRNGDLLVGRVLNIEGGKYSIEDLITGKLRTKTDDSAVSGRRGSMYRMAIVPKGGALAVVAVFRSAGKEAAREAAVSLVKRYRERGKVRLLPAPTPLPEIKRLPPSRLVPGQLWANSRNTLLISSRGPKTYRVRDVPTGKMRKGNVSSERFRASHEFLGWDSRVQFAVRVRVERVRADIPDLGRITSIDWNDGYVWVLWSSSSRPSRIAFERFLRANPEYRLD